MDDNLGQFDDTNDSLDSGLDVEFDAQAKWPDPPNIDELAFRPVVQQLNIDYGDEHEVNEPEPDHVVANIEREDFADTEPLPDVVDIEQEYVVATERFHTDPNQNQFDQDLSMIVDDVEAVVDPDHENDIGFFLVSFS